MKKFIIFLLPILFLFSCTKPYYEIEESHTFKGVYKAKFSKWDDKIAYTVAIDFDGCTYSYIRSEKDGRNATTLKTGNLENISFANDVLCYDFDGITYKHKVRIVIPYFEVELTLEPEEYGVFWWGYKMHGIKNQSHKITMDFSKLK